MAIWTAELKELERLYESFKGQLPNLENELERLIKADDENMILLYSRRCLEVIISDLCECELNRERGTEPLKGIIDKLNKVKKIPSHIASSMYGLNEISTYGTHPKDFDPEQVKPVLVNLDIIIKWYLKYKDLQTYSKPEQVVSKYETKQQSISPSDKSIIVLPFENISSDPEQEYFSDGLTEEIITDLSHVHDLLVISRSSAMTYKGTRKKIKEITEEINVRYVLEGSVRKVGNDLRIVAQLIDATTDTHIWAEKYSGTLNNIFNIQENISRAIVDSLKVRLSLDEKKKIAERSITDIQAYDLYLRSRKEVFYGTKESLGKALELIKNGLDIIGNNELLYGALGNVYLHYYNLGIKQEESVLDKVKECADKIFSLNPDSYMGYYLRALIFWKKGDIKNTIVEHKKALRVNSNHFDSLMQVGYFYLISGKISKAKPFVERLIEVSPLDSLTHYIAGWVEFAKGNFEDGLKYLKKMYMLDPDNLFWQIFYGHGLAYLNKIEEACRLFDSIVNESKVIWVSNLAEFYKFSLQHKKKNALQSVTEDLRNFAKGDEFFPLLMAEGYALIDEKIEAINWLEIGEKWGFINYPFLNEYDPLLENIRSEERFKRLMERVKYEWENFKV